MKTSQKKYNELSLKALGLANRLRPGARKVKECTRAMRHLNKSRAKG